MPQTALIFTLPDERGELRDAQDGSALRAAAYDYANWLRSRLKYGELNADERRGLEQCRETFSDAFEGLLEN